MNFNFSPCELQAFFLDAAEKCVENTLPYFRASAQIANKSDDGFDPVTTADKQTESALRELIMARFPEHGILGEEHGAYNVDADYCWIIDPIDGTRAFIAGLPSWGCLLGLTLAGRPIAGMMHQPFTGEIWYSLGDQSWFSHGGAQKKIASSQVGSLAEATLMSTAPEIFSDEKFRKFETVRKQALLCRFGFDCYAYAMLASGHVDLIIESDLQSYDIAALIPIIEHAGGVVTTWDGGPASAGGDIIAAANPELLLQATELLCH